MKVTALIPDDLVSEVTELAHGKNLTDSLIKALREWSAIRKTQHLRLDVINKPISFHKGFSSACVRELSRRT
jgi:hypothetical protein